MRNTLIKDMDDVENALIRMGKDDGIWQNNLIRLILRVQFDLILAMIRVMKGK